jgi:uncharacterized Tic20 family protein
MSTQTNEPPPVSGVTPDERTWGTLAHVIALFAGVIGALIVWLIKKNESAFVAHHGREALNFQITMLIAGVALLLLAFVTCGLGIPLLVVVPIANIICCVLGAVKANEGRLWTYPVSIRLVS